MFNLMMLMSSFICLKHFVLTLTTYDPLDMDTLLIQKLFMDPKNLSGNI